MGWPAPHLDPPPHLRLHHHRLGTCPAPPVLALTLLCMPCTPCTCPAPPAHALHPLHMPCTSCAPPAQGCICPAPVHAAIQVVLSPSPSPTLIGALRCRANWARYRGSCHSVVLVLGLDFHCCIGSRTLLINSTGAGLWSVRIRITCTSTLLPFISASLAPRTVEERQGWPFWIRVTGREDQGHGSGLQAEVGPLQQGRGHVRVRIRVMVV